MKPISKYITIEEFINQSGLKQETIYKNRNNIPGLKYIDGNYEILEGTRFPFNTRNNKIKNSEDRRYLILKAIGEFRYIDEEKLHISRREFEKMITQLKQARLISENGSHNHYGTNGYSLEMKAEELLSMKKKNAERMVTELIAQFLADVVKN